MLVQSPGKLSYVILDPFMKTYPKFVTLHAFFNHQHFFQKRKKKRINSYGFWKINKIIRNLKKNESPDYLWNNYFFRQFSTLLLRNICVFDIFNVVDFFQNFVISRSTEILISLNKCTSNATYIPNEKFYSIRISVLRDINKVCKKSLIPMMSRSHFFNFMKIPFLEKKIEAKTVHVLVQSPEKLVTLRSFFKSFKKNLQKRKKKFIRILKKQ